MDNLLGLGAKSVCGFFPGKFNMTSKMAVKILSWFTQK